MVSHKTKRDADRENVRSCLRFISVSQIGKGRGEFGGEFLPAEYGIDVGKLRHRRPVSL